MKTRIQYNFLLLLLILIGFSCKKDSHPVPSLPPATQNGSNTMGAKIDGIIWTSFSCATCFENDRIGARWANGNLSVEGDSTGISKTNLQILLQLTNVFSIGVYTLGPKNDNPLVYSNHAEINYFNSNGNSSYYTNSVYKGTVTITRFDVQKSIVSGTFSFDAANTNNSTDVKHVTEGRFDTIYIGN